MKKCLLAVSCCVTLAAAMLAYAQSGDEGYQPATVVSIEKIAVSAQHPENGDGYKIFMRMAGVTYGCRANGPAAVFIDWSPGKEYPAKLNDKVLLVKGPGGPAELNIFKRTPK
ncbi:MAG: hypothetical protein ABR902_06345 [Candidatus Korobacteraceae bacterium]|jgi:hypothetical protein